MAINGAGRPGLGSKAGQWGRDSPPNGEKTLLYCTTPNFNALSRRVLRSRWSVIEYPEHLVYYTPRTLGTWLARAGFNRESIITWGISLSRMRAVIATPSGSHAPHVSDDEGLREAIERSAVLRLAKSSLNRALGARHRGHVERALLAAIDALPSSG